MAETTKIEFEIPDTPPREAKPDSSSTARAKMGRPRGYSPKLETQIVEMVAGIGMLVSFRDNVCGMHVMSQAESFAKAWTHLAAENPRVKRALEALMQGSAWSGVITASIAMAIPILAHHDLLPAMAMANPFAVAEPEPVDEEPEAPAESPPPPKRKPNPGKATGNENGKVKAPADAIPGNPLV